LIEDLLFEIPAAAE
jgi:hypothetical protein